MSEVDKNPFAMLGGKSTHARATYASPDPKIDTQDPAWVPGRKLPPLTTSLIVGVMPTEGGVNTWFN